MAKVDKASPPVRPRQGLASQGKGGQYAVFPHICICGVFAYVQFRLCFLRVGENKTGEKVERCRLENLLASFFLER